MAAIRITDPDQIRRFERLAVGGANKTPKKATPAPPQASTVTTQAPTAKKPHQRAARRHADPIRVDDRVKISTETVEAAIRAIPGAVPMVYRSKLEATFARDLDARRMVGEIRRWWYEPASFRLPGGHWYTPDFVLELPDGRLEWIETKGYLWRHDALKIDAFREVWSGINYRIEK